MQQKCHALFNEKPSKSDNEKNSSINQRFGIFRNFIEIGQKKLLLSCFHHLAYPISDFSQYKKTFTRENDI